MLVQGRGAWVSPRLRVSHISWFGVSSFPVTKLSPQKTAPTLFLRGAFIKKILDYVKAPKQIGFKKLQKILDCVASKQY
jgi:hypothetical protein